jgi:ribosomal protein S18 acetylase RimI-like enzyme
MSPKNSLTAGKIVSAEGRAKALRVLGAVYRGEKKWVTEAESVFPATDLDNPAVSWFLAELGGRPVGVTRVLYEIPLGLYEEYGFERVEGGIDVGEFVRNHRIAEIGRFAVLPRFRRRIRIAAILMRTATTETVDRGFTHLITDVFEGEATSPYEFHKSVLGFQTVATHEVGELRFEGRRITMLLDLRDAYERLKRGKSWIFRYVAGGWNEQMVQKLMAPAAAGGGPQGI